MKKLFISIFIINIFSSLLFSSEINASKNVDCIILEDENSIICKYILQREEYDKKVIFRWLEPNGNLSRQRDLNVSAGHGSVYDFRYIQGRQKGTWTLEVLDNNQTFKTTFIIE